jgi:hypothetical protein
MKLRGLQKAPRELASPKTYERNLANLKLLAAYPPFHEEVLRMRKILNIKPEGISGDELEKWQDSILRKSDEFMETKEFLSMQRQVKKQREQKKVSPRMAKRQLELIDSLVPINKLHSFADILIERFRLPESYHGSLVTYILTGKITALFNNFAGAPMTWDEYRKNRSVTIKIYTQLAPDEIKALRNFIDWLSKGKLPQYRPLKDIDLQLQIKNAYDDRKPHNSTHDNERILLADLAEEYLGSRKKANRISAIVRDIKRTQMRRFGS